MTEKELIDLEIEKRALEITACEMGKGDAVIDTRIRAMVDGLRAKAVKIQVVINNFLNKE